jgi:hypothetical protein
MRRKSVYLQGKMPRTAAVVSAVAAAVLLGLATPTPATAATDDPGFLCSVTGGTSTPRANTPRRDSDAICAAVFLPDLVGRGTSSP